MNLKKDKMRFAQAMAALGEIFDAGRESSALKTELYFQSLEKFSIDEIEKASTSLINTRTTATFPKPGEITEAIEGRREDKARRAWAVVDDTMRKHGNYVSVNFGQPKIHRCIEMLGGWEYLGTLTEDEWKWKRKEFESLYEALPEQGPDHIAGFIEKSNIEKGYDPPPVLQVGDKAKAQKLLQ